MRVFGSFERPTEGERPRPAYRPPVGIPTRDPGQRRWTLASVLLHALVIFLAFAPPLIFSARVFDISNAGAGGPGPAGGGGGGNGGTGGGKPVTERLQYFKFFEPPKPEPVPEVVTPPTVPPPPEPPKPVPKEEKPNAAADVKADTSKSDAASVSAGTGGGTGKDGTAGNGPGSGGGTGSGVGTGKGSGNGPGTGGGTEKAYPPTVIALPILPLPVPSKVRPYNLVAYFDVDSLGNATLLSFTPSKDGGYNKKILEMLREIRFRPAVRANGAPMRDTAMVSAFAP